MSVIIVNNTKNEFRTMIKYFTFELLPHSSNFPDLVSCNLYLFPNFKIWHGGKKFSSNEDIMAVQNMKILLKNLKFGSKIILSPIYLTFYYIFSKVDIFLRIDLILFKNSNILIFYLFFIKDKINSSKSYFITII